MRFTGIYLREKNAEGKFVLAFVPTDVVYMSEFDDLEDPLIENEDGLKKYAPNSHFNLIEIPEVHPLFNYAILHAAYFDDSLFTGYVYDDMMNIKEMVKTIYIQPLI